MMRKRMVIRNGRTVEIYEDRGKGRGRSHGATPFMTRRNGQLEPGGKRVTRKKAG